MALPIALPIVPVLKLLALGTLKSVFLILGACFFPRWTLRLMIGGASGMILPVARSMCDGGCLDETVVGTLTTQLQSIQDHEFDRPEARAILLGLVRKTIMGMVDSVRGIPKTVADIWHRRDQHWSSLTAGCRASVDWLTRKSRALSAGRSKTSLEKDKQA